MIANGSSIRNNWLRNLPCNYSRSEKDEGRNNSDRPAILLLQPTPCVKYILDQYLHLLFLVQISCLLKAFIINFYQFIFPGRQIIENQFSSRALV